MMEEWTDPDHPPLSYKKYRRLCRASYGTSRLGDKELDALRAEIEAEYASAEEKKMRKKSAKERFGSFDLKAKKREEQNAKRSTGSGKSTSNAAACCTDDEETETAEESEEKSAKNSEMGAEEEHAEQCLHEPMNGIMFGSSGKSAKGNEHPDFSVNPFGAPMPGLPMHRNQLNRSLFSTRHTRSEIPLNLMSGGFSPLTGISYTDRLCMAKAFREINSRICLHSPRPEPFSLFSPLMQRQETEKGEGRRRTTGMQFTFQDILMLEKEMEEEERRRRERRKLAAKGARKSRGEKKGVKGAKKEKKEKEEKKYVAIGDENGTVAKNVPTRRPKSRARKIKANKMELSPPKRFRAEFGASAEGSVDSKNSDVLKPEEKNKSS